ncbi:AAA family ATPase [Methylorubrum extorquens]|uniref:AAA family ATPase n=1 Tax=Methylorubrum extorquens TaxID=408 RepID=UPI00209F88DF|nr:DNA repair exonuclease SbcCD ATPase subunit [Methylorubrum extorquens]
MKILDVEIENFLTIAQAKVTMNERGLVLVQGENLCDSSADSNGAGKSTFADGVFWCLYDETSREVSGDDVINWAAKKGTRVATRVEDGGNTYTIARHRKHKTAKNRLLVTMVDPDGETHDLTLGTDKLTQTVVNEIIGCSREVFIAAVLAGQDQMPDLPGMTDKNLKVIVEEAAGTTVLEKGHRVALTQLNEAKAALDKAKMTADVAVGRFDDAVGALDQAGEDLNAWERDRKGEIERLTDEVRNLVGVVKVKRGELATENRPAVEAQLAAEEAKLAGLAGEVTEERRLSHELTLAQRLVDGHQHSIDTISARARRLKADHDGLDHKVGCPCSSCDKPYTAADIAPAKANAASALRAELVTLRDVKSDHANAVAALEIARSAVETHRASMTDASATHALCARLRASLVDLDRRQREIDQIVERARTLGEQIKRSQAQPNPHEAIQARCSEAVERTNEVMIEAQAAERAQALELEIAREVCEVFAPAGARAEMLDEVTPYLNAQTAKYLGTLSDGNIRASWSTLTRSAKGELKEKFSIEVTHALGGDKFKAISGGEKRKVRVAAALALQDLVASRASKTIPLFIGDEIDNALDSAGIERLTTILQEKARERGTVFIISHSDLKDWVPQVMKVTKTGRGASKIEEVFA